MNLISKLLKKFKTDTKEEFRNFFGIFLTEKQLTVAPKEVRSKSVLDEAARDDFAFVFLDSQVCKEYISGRLLDHGKEHNEMRLSGPRLYYVIIQPLNKEDNQKLIDACTTGDKIVRLNEYSEFDVIIDSINDRSWDYDMLCSRPGFSLYPCDTEINILKNLDAFNYAYCFGYHDFIAKYVDNTLRDIFCMNPEIPVEMYEKIIRTYIPPFDQCEIVEEANHEEPNMRNKKMVSLIHSYLLKKLFSMAINKE